MKEPKTNEGKSAAKLIEKQIIEPADWEPGPLNRVQGAHPRRGAPDYI